MAAKVAAPLPFRRDLKRDPLGWRPPGARGGRRGSALCWTGGGGRHAAPPTWLARVRGRNRSPGGGSGGRSATREHEEEDEKAEVLIVDAGDEEEEFSGDELAGFRGLVLDISYR
jgi:hypothetical protein